MAAARGFNAARRLGAAAIVAASLANCCAAEDPVAEDAPSAADAPTSILVHDPSALAAYEQQLPGSDVAFEMLPVAAGVLRIYVGPEGGQQGAEAEAEQMASIRIEPFWMGKHEVRWAEYWQYMELCTVFEKFADQGIRPLDDKHGLDAVTAPSKLYEPSFTYAAGDGPQQPAVSMSQYAAKQYTKWLSLTTGIFHRLPTDAEWEYACRAGTATAYSFGDDPADIQQYGWYYDNADDMTHPVGAKKANPWGFHDLHGNACEWVLDEYRDNWYAQFAGQEVSVVEALCWPDKVFPRVLRGGSWWLDADQCRSDSRRPSDDDNWRSYDPNSPQSPWWFASDDAQDVGFRVVRPLVPPPRDQWSKYWDADLPAIQEVVDLRIDSEGRGERGKVDPDLPQAIQQLDNNPQEAASRSDQP